MMYSNIMLKFCKKRFTVKEHITMSENLGDAISQLLMKDTNKNLINTRIRVGLAKTAALVKNKVRCAQIRYVDLSDSGKLDETEKEERLVRIIELKEEYEHLRFRMFAPSLIDDDTDSQKWRCIFRTIRDRKTSHDILDFVRIYNKWTAASADYMILKALCDLECGEEKERSDVQIKLAEEYDDKIRNQEELMESYLLDLHEIAAEIDSKCKIFEILENLNSELVFTSEKATFRRCNTRRRKPL